MPFKKGDKHINRNGRPKKGLSWCDVLTELCDEEVKAGGTRLTKMQAIGHKIIKKAFDGDLQAAQILMDRIDGKPRQSMNIEHSGDSTVKVTREVVWIKDSIEKAID